MSSSHSDENLLKEENMEKSTQKHFILYKKTQNWSNYVYFRIVPDFGLQIFRNRVPKITNMLQIWLLLVVLQIKLKIVTSGLIGVSKTMTKAPSRHLRIHIEWIIKRINII